MLNEREIKVVNAVRSELGLCELLDCEIETMTSMNYGDQDGHSHLVFVKDKIINDANKYETFYSILSQMYQNIFLTGTTCWKRSELYNQRVKPLTVIDSDIDYMTIISVIKCSTYYDILGLMSFFLAWLHNECKQQQQ